MEFCDAESQFRATYKTDWRLVINGEKQLFFTKLNFNSKL
jgi:hypothetical protein